VVAMVNKFNAVELADLGYSVKESNEDYAIIVSLSRGDEVIVWKIGDWMQFRCMFLDLRTLPGSNGYIKISESINRLHDIAMGARISLGDTGEIVLVADVLSCTLDNEVAAKISGQLLYLCDKLNQPLRDVFLRERSLSTADIDNIFR
jgi:hypothetical protein